MKLDRNEVKKVYAKRAIAEIYKYEYFEHAVEIGALRKLGVKHRLIADLLNKNVKTKSIVDRHEVSRIWKKWEALGYITEDLKQMINSYAESLTKDDLNDFDFKDYSKEEINNQWSNI